MPVTIYGGIRGSVFDGIAQVFTGGEPVALMDSAGETLIAGEVVLAAPVIIQEPAILPSNAVQGDVATLSLGTAQGHPEAEASWDLSLDGVSIAGSVDAETMSVTLSAPGAYALTVSWTNAAGSVTADAVTLTVAVPVVDVAPSVTQQPAFQPGAAEPGDSVTLNLGQAAGLPAPVAEWELTRNGLSVKGDVDPETMTVALAEPGVYRLSVDWSNRAGSVAAAAASLTVTTRVPDVAPSIVRQPAILPATAVIGDSITLDLGAADGMPAPVATWGFTRNGVSIKDSLDPGGLTMELASAGVYVLSASWTNSAGSVTAQTATLTVQAPPVPAINYDTQALAYFDAATTFAGSATDVTSVTARGTGGVILSKNGTGATIQHSAAGLTFANGSYLQSPTLTGLPTTDGVFAVVDCTLTSYGSNLGQILEGAGGHVKIRNNAGNLQVVGSDDSSVALVLGSVIYGSRVILAGMLDDVLNAVNGINTAGGDISAAHGGITEPELTRIFTGRYVHGTIHRLAIVGRAEGQAWPVTMREVYADFRRGE